MLRSAPRRALVPAALAVLVLVAVALVVPSRSTASAQTAHRAMLTSSASARDDGRPVSAAPTTGPEWLANQLRGASGAEQQSAVLLVAVALIVARRWRRAADEVRVDRDPLRISWSASRAPPAFA